MLSVQTGIWELLSILQNMMPSVKLQIFSGPQMNLHKGGLRSLIN